jgi:hypothetical protein
MGGPRVVVTVRVAGITGRQCLVCADCGRLVPCPVEDVDRYASDGWPRCCGEVMSLAEAGRHEAPRRPVA